MNEEVDAEVRLSGGGETSGPREAGGLRFSLVKVVWNICPVLAAVMRSIRSSCKTCPDLTNILLKDLELPREFY